MSERIACPDLKPLRILILLGALSVLIPVSAGCGESEPDPATVLDRALTLQNLSRFAQDADGPGSGVVAVQALGYEDRVLSERQVAAEREVMSEIRQALGAESGLRALVEDLEYHGQDVVNGVVVEHVSGELGAEALARALARAGADDVSALADLDPDSGLEDALAGADFDLYAGSDDGVIRRLDLTLALDDPDNALPPSRIRFSLTPASSVPGA